MSDKNKLFLFSSLAIGVLAFWLFNASKCSDQNLDQPEVVTSDVTVANYERFCAGCHGMFMERFSGNDREKLFSTSVEEMIKVISEGDMVSGMPAFKGTFSELEIDSLAHYILTDIKEASKTHDYRPSLASLQKSEKLTFKIDTVITGLEVPWGMVWLPDGDMLVTERSGRLLRYRNGIFAAAIEGVPSVYANGQGGLLDIKLHPDYPENGWVYLSYSTLGEGAESAGGNTAILRAKINGNKLIDQQLLFKATPDSRSGVHFGCRMLFGNDGLLYFSVGERGHMQNAQTLTNHSGKIHRITDDGKIPADNPFVNTSGAMPSIYSYGHRNPQGLVKHPQTGTIWSHEHGPKGGDEINIIRKGLNYGWPVISFGINYNGTILTPDTAKVGMEQPIYYWTPSIGACGMAFVTGNRYKGWENNILSGSLSFRYLVRTEIDGERTTHHEILLKEIGRVRNVEMGPDGFIYVAVETPGLIVRLVPVDVE
jgi:glucose/arabinose dehydrogenase